MCDMSANERIICAIIRGLLIQHNGFLVLFCCKHYREKIITRLPAGNVRHAIPEYQEYWNYYPTLLPRVQISRETSTNNRYLYSSHSSWPREVQNLGKSEFWEKKSLFVF